MARPKREDGKNAKNQAVIKYIKNNYDRIVVNTKKGNRDILKKWCIDNGFSINGYINKLLAENIPNFKI